MVRRCRGGNYQQASSRAGGAWPLAAQDQIPPASMVSCSRLATVQ